MMQAPLHEVSCVVKDEGKTQAEREEIRLVRALSIASATDVEEFFKGSEVELCVPTDP